MAEGDRAQRLDVGLTWRLERSVPAGEWVGVHCSAQVEKVALINKPP
jgi:hypothetical protein